MSTTILNTACGTRFSHEAAISVKAKSNFGFDSLNLSPNLTGLGKINLSLSEVSPDQLSNLVVSSDYSVSGYTLDNVTTLGVQFFETLDPFILIGELFLLLFILSLGSKLISSLSWTQGYSDIVSLCQLRSISIIEIFTLTTFSIGFIVFDAFVTLSEDDLLEGISYLFISIIGLAVALLFLAIDLQYYYLVSAISGGELSLRIIYNDILNNGLCLLRIVFCWVRYLFYDLQSELVDLSFHYTELAENDSIAWIGFSAYLDMISMVFQLLIGAFKLMLALFLFWLILDLFLLRTAARSELQTKSH